MALTIHELCTNAVKYGALSKPTGQVCLSWIAHSSTSGELDIRWEERGGPEVEVPLAKGFGARLIEEALPREIQGTVKLAFRPDGLICTISGKIPQGDAG